MKAIVADRYGPPEALRLRDIDPPVVADDEVLVRVHAASVHPDVWHAVLGRPYVLRLMGNGLRAPKRRVPGTDMAGRVESVGRRFQPGDEVFGETIRGHQWRNGGAYAEHVSVPEDVLAPKPANLTRSGERYDLVFDVPGNHSFSACRHVLAPTGTYVLIGHDGFGGRRWLGSLPRLVGLMARTPFSRALPSLDFSTPSRRETMDALAGLIEAGSLTAVVDRSFPLEQVADAIRYLESGTAVGRVVVTVP